MYVFIYLNKRAFSSSCEDLPILFNASSKSGAISFSQDKSISDSNLVWPMVVRNLFFIIFT